MAKVTIHEERCKGCALCVYACPKKILELSRSKLNSKGYYPAAITDMDACIACMSCARTCPDLVFEIEK